jgi:hypothetical protein
MVKEMQFFVLKLKVGTTHETWFSEMKPARQGEAKRCPACDCFVSMLPWLPPYRAELQAYGKALGDIAFGPGGDLLVSDRFRSAWEAANLRGLEFSPLERIRVRPARLGKKTPTYFYVLPQPYGTQVDLERSLIETNRPITCNTCKSGGVDNIRGFVIDESSWTGEDMFEPWGLLGVIVVTDRVRQLRDDYGLTNINLTPVEEYFWDPLYKWTPVDNSPPDWYKPDNDDVTDESSAAN